MLTLFAIPKAFKGNTAVIQRNAIRSWTLLRPACEIILFGDDEGAAEIAAEFGIRHVPEITKNEYGTPIISDVFKKAGLLSSNGIICYVNADIILMSDFINTVKKLPKRPFLMVGQRRDLKIEEEIRFEKADWEKDLRIRVSKEGELHGPSGIDYFVFPRGLWNDIPPFALGRTTWDNWFVYKARSIGAFVLDATEVVMAIHQDHRCAHNFKDVDELWNSPEAKANRELTDGGFYPCTIEDANRIFSSKGISRPSLTLSRIKRFILTFHALYPNAMSFIRSVKNYTIFKKGNNARCI